MALLLLFAVLLQDPADVRSVTVPKQERSTYIPVLEKFRDAEGLLATDVLDCARRCTEMIEDKTIKEPYREARVRVQNTDGSYGDWMTFVPFQLRGRAWLARAQSVAAREAGDGAESARKAVSDLEESVRRGMKSSGLYLDQARRLSSSFKEPAPPGEDPRLAAAEREMAGLRALGGRKDEPRALLARCDEAAEKIRGTPHEGEWKLLREGALRSVAEQFQARLRETLTPVDAWATLRSLGAAEFERRFEAAPPDPALEWIRRCRAELLRAREAAPPERSPLPDFLKLLDGTAQVALDAVVREGDSRSFDPLEALFHDLSRVRLESLLQGTDTLPPDPLRARRDEAQAVLSGFTGMRTAMDRELGTWPDRGAAFRRQHPQFAVHLEGLERSLSRFPSDLEGLDAIGKVLFDTADPRGPWGDAPREALRRIENSLPKLETIEARPLTRDSRQRLATYHLVVRSLRLLLSDERAEAIARREDFREIGRRLREAGGPDPEVMRQVGPKVARIAEAIPP